MRFVLQRVKHASVKVDGELIGSIGRGYMVLMGVSDTDTEEITDKMVDKMCKLRIFEDENGKTNCSLADVDGEILLISQFTLYADCSHGNRPGFTGAGNPELANHLYEHALAMHGVVILKDGTSMDICIGEKEGDPVFCVTDLLPHLAAQQNERKLKDGIKGEELNIIVGSLPYPCEEEDSIKEPVKLLALSILNERFGMTEKDFLRAEIEFVPAVKATDVGLDRSLVGAYGQDDKVCAYTALTAEMKAKSPEYTTVTILADKEEIGSVGNTGLNSDFTLHYIEGLCKAGNVDVRKVLKHSLCLSADVNAAYDPTFASVFEEKNSCYLNKGVVLTKYTGARGKSGSNDASAETMAKVIQIMDEAGVYWQIGELGAVDVGGGGTVALFVAGMDVDVVDMGVPILSMHAPFELASKLDIYNTYLAFAAFCN